MDRKYWEKIAPAYNDEIFDVLQNDKKAIIRSAIRKYAGPKKSVIDIGCAVGKWIPFLSSHFKKVMAVDISSGNLSIAKKTYPEAYNVEYRRSDMSAGKTSFSRFDVAVCINAILTDSLKKRKAFFRNISLSLKKGGALVLVVPSLESWLMTRIIQHQWQIDRSLFKDNISDREAASRYANIRQGNVEIDSVATKHYLGDELQLLLEREGLIVQDTQKIHYDWKTEFVRPPSWLREPRPFDWLVVANKLSR